MTKDELEKEARDYADNQIGCGDGYYEWTDIENAYLAGAEPREKRIEALERKLEQTEKDLTDYQFNYPKIKDLEKENAELKRDKKDLIFIRNQKAKCMCEDKEQLTKAKGLLRAWFQYCIDTKGKTPLQIETAQFLSEVEK